MRFKPHGYTSLAPYLLVNDVKRFLEFVADVFQAQPIRQVDRPDGSIRHVEVRIDDTILMAGQPAQGAATEPAHLHVYVADVDAAYLAALQAGAVHVQAPIQDGDPDRRAGIVDPVGNTWWIATQVGLPPDPDDDE